MNLSKSTNIPPHEWTSNFQCLVYVDDILLLNSFSVNIGFFTVVENPILNDIELDKIEMFFNTLLAGCIMLDKEKYSSDLTNVLKNNFFMIPGKPNDQTVGSLIYSKLVAMVGKNLEIDFITISSKLGDEVRFTIVEESGELEVLLPRKQDWWSNSADPWWMRSDPATYDLELEDDIYRGDFTWEDMFESELKEAEKLNSKATTKFQIIPGGKNAD